MTFWQKNGWWIPLLCIVLLATALKIAEDKPDLVMTSSEQRQILIIDPGHGGADGGAVAPNGSLECDINLDIALRLEALAAFWGEQTLMTRRGTELDYPSEARTISARKIADQRSRLEFVNSVPAAMLLSIHQNNYPAPQPYGPQVFFSQLPGSEDFAKLLQNNLSACLVPNNRRLASPVSEKVFLMKRSANPAVLVECGFLSNPEELERLESDSYRRQLAAVLLASWLQYSNGILA